MSITIERNQKIQNLQIIEKKFIYIYIYNYIYDCTTEKYKNVIIKRIIQMLKL